MSGGELILYTAEDGRAAVQLRAEGGTVWLTQAEITTLFDTSKQNISLRIKNVLDEGELPVAATVKDSLTVQTEAARLVSNAEDMAALEQTERQPEGKGRGKKK